MNKVKKKKVKISDRNDLLESDFEQMEEELKAHKPSKDSLEDITNPVFTFEDFIRDIKKNIKEVYKVYIYLPDKSQIKKIFIEPEKAIDFCIDNYMNEIKRLEGFK